MLSQMETKKCTASPPPASTPIRVPFARCLYGAGSSTATAVAKRAAAVAAATVATAPAPADQTSPRSDVPPWWVAIRACINRNRESV